MHANSHIHTDVRTCMHEHTQHLPSSILFISSPSSFIRGLPCTSMITSHTVINASLVYFCLKRRWRISFCSIRLGLLVIILRSLFEMISMSVSPTTMALASTSLMNRSWKWSRTCSTAQKGESCYTQTSNAHLPSTHCETDQWCVVTQR